MFAQRHPVDGVQQNGIGAPRVPQQLLGAVNGAPYGMGADAMSNVLAGTPFAQPKQSAYLQGADHLNINDILRETTQEVVQMIMNKIGSRKEAVYYRALPKLNFEKDMLKITRIIYNNDAPAPRAPEAPNPVQTVRTMQSQMTMQQHGAAIITESMGLTTEGGKAHLVGQMIQVEENFNQYLINLIAIELLRRHDAVDTTGSRRRAGKTFETAEHFRAYLQDRAGYFNIFHKHSDPLTFVFRAISRMIDDQAGTYDMLIVPGGALDIATQMQIENTLNKGGSGASAGGVSAIEQSFHLPLRGCDPLAQDVCTGQWAHSEYSKLPASQRGIEVHDEARDNFSKLDLLSGLVCSGAFKMVPGTDRVMGLTDLGRAYFSGYTTWEDYLEDTDTLATIRDFALNRKVRRRLLALAHENQNVAGRVHVERPGQMEALLPMDNPSASQQEARRAMKAVFKDRGKSNKQTILADAMAVAIMNLVTRASRSGHGNVAGIQDGIARFADTVWDAIELGVPGIEDAPKNSDEYRKAVSLAFTLCGNLYSAARLPNADTLKLLVEGKTPLAAIEEYEADDTGDIDDIMKRHIAKYPGFLVHLAKVDAPVPIGIAWFRPYMRFETVATIGCAQGGRTGYAFYGNSVIEWGGNATIQNKNVTVNTRFGACVTNPNNLAVLQNSVVKNYISGGGIRLFDYSPGALKRLANGGRRDINIIPVLVPPNWTPEHDVIDITGNFHSGLVPANAENLHYPSARVYSAALGLKHGTSEDARNGTATAHNTIMWRMQQRAETTAQRDLGVDTHEGTGPLGRFAPGAAGQRRGNAGAPVELRGGERQTYTPYQA